MDNLKLVESFYAVDQEDAKELLAEFPFTHTIFEHFRMKLILILEDLLQVQEIRHIILAEDGSGYEVK